MHGGFSERVCVRRNNPGDNYSPHYIRGRNVPITLAYAIRSVWFANTGCLRTFMGGVGRVAWLLGVRTVIGRCPGRPGSIGTLVTRSVRLRVRKTGSLEELRQMHPLNKQPFLRVPT